MAASLAPDDDDDAVMGTGGCEMQKVVAITGQENAAALVSKLQDSVVR